jgi:hypothetical protein
MQSQSLINSLSIDSSLDAATLLWELDEQQIRFAELKHFSPGSQHVVVTMHFHGAVEIEPISEQEWEQLYDIARTSGSNASDHDNNFKRLPDSNNMPSPDGRYVPDDQSWGSWIDTQTGQRIRFPGNSSAAVPESVGSYWHPDSEWVFLGYEWCFAGCGLVVGRVNIFNPASGHVREIADCHSHPTCVNWLPEQVNIEELPPGRSTSLLPEPESIDYRTGFAAENDGLTFILEDVATHVLMCNLESQPRSMTLVQNETTGEIDFILPSGEACNFIQEGEAYVPEMRAIFFALSPDNRYYAITNQIGNTEYTSLFDAQTGELIATLNIYGIRLEFSDDSVTLITWGRYAIATWDILDMERGLVWE